MAMRFTIEAGKGQHVVVFAAADDAVVDLFVGNALLEAVWGSKLDCQTFARTALLAGARALLADVQAQWDVLPYRYGVEVRMLGREDLKTSGGGGVHGIPIDGRIHSIDAGAGRCVLSVWEYGPDGRGVVVASRDVRGEKRIETDGWGPIKISRRKLDVTLPRTLVALIEFLERMPDELMRGRTTEGTASVMTLVRRAAEGDESAEEVLFDMGEAARAELLEKAADAKARRHHGTIAWLLLTVLPSPESRAAVEAMAGRETDGERRNQLLTLLASMTSK